MDISELIQVTYSSAKDEINIRETNSLIIASNELECDNLTVITWDYEATEFIRRARIPRLSSRG